MNAIFVSYNDWMFSYNSFNATMMTLWKTLRYGCTMEDIKVGCDMDDIEVRCVMEDIEVGALWKTLRSGALWKTLRSVRYGRH